MGIVSVLLFAVGVLYLHLLFIAGLTLMGAALFIFLKARRVVWWRRF